MPALPLAVPTVRPAPRREPPYDDEVEPPGRTVDTYLQPCLPFAPPHRARPSGRPAARVAARGGPAGPNGGGFARALVLAILEVVGGRRPAGQLRRHVSPSVYAALVRPTGWPAPFRASSRSPHVLGVRVGRPSRSSAEIAATVCVAGRIRAVAARLEWHHGHWQCVTVALL